MAELLGHDDVGSPVDQFHQIGSVLGWRFQGTPELGVGGLLVFHLMRHPLIGRGIRKILRHKGVELPTEMVVVTPSERTGTGDLLVSEVVPAVDHEVDGTLIGHAFQPPLPDAEGDGNEATCFHDILVGPFRIEGGEVTDVILQGALGEGRSSLRGTYDELRTIRQGGCGEALGLSEIESALVEVEGHDLRLRSAGLRAAGDLWKVADLGGPDHDLLHACGAFGACADPKAELVRVHADGLVEGDGDRAGGVSRNDGGRDVLPLATALELDLEGFDHVLVAESGEKVDARQFAALSEIELDPGRLIGGLADPARIVAHLAVDRIGGGVFRHRRVGLGGADLDGFGGGGRGNEAGADEQAEGDSGFHQ